MLIVVIPTFNAAEPLSQLLEQLDGVRTIVSDGGSDDDTLQVALRHRATLSVGRSGRGAQLALGAKLAKLSGSPDDWFLFLHADSILPENWRAVIVPAIRHGNPRYFRFKASGSDFTSWWIDRMVALRCWAWKLPYGDQGLLISRTLYESLGGYSDMPLFEDVEIIDRINRKANLKPLPAALKTDISKHRRDGLWRRGLRNLGLLRRYRKGMSADALLERYSQ